MNDTEDSGFRGIDLDFKFTVNEADGMHVVSSPELMGMSEHSLFNLQIEFAK